MPITDSAKDQMFWRFKQSEKAAYAAISEMEEYASEHFGHDTNDFSYAKKQLENAVNDFVNSQLRKGVCEIHFLQEKK